jgi:hypothetical protein
MTNKITLDHVVSREVLHFAWSYVITDWVWTGLSALHRLSVSGKLHPNWAQSLVADSSLGRYGEAIVLVVVFSFLREPRDVEAGDPAWKSYVDFSWWALGGISAALMNHLKWGS